MALKISLKPQEKIVVNGAVIANGDRTSHLHFLNDARLLREKDIMVEEAVKTDEDYFYFLIQLIYIDPEHAKRYRLQLGKIAKMIAGAHPDREEIVESILFTLDAGHIYEAMRDCRKAFGDIHTKGTAQKVPADGGSHRREDKHAAEG